MNMCSFNITKRLKLEVLIICNLLTFRSVRVFVSYDKYATLTQISFHSSCLCIPSILSWLIPQESPSCLNTPDSGVFTLDTKLFQSLLHFRVMANCYDDLRPQNIRSFNNISLTQVLLKMFSRVKHVIIWLKFHCSVQNHWISVYPSTPSSVHFTSICFTSEHQTYMTIHQKVSLLSLIQKSNLINI